MDITGVNAFVTGAASGIGRETALALARAGSPVMATDVDAKGLAQLAVIFLNEPARPGLKALSGLCVPKT